MMLYKLLKQLTENSITAPLISIYSSGNDEHNYNLFEIIVSMLMTPPPPHITSAQAPLKIVINISKTSSTCLPTSDPPSALNLLNVSRIFSPLASISPHQCSVKHKLCWRVKLEPIGGQKQAGWNRRVGLRREFDQNLQVLLNINMSDECPFVIQVCLIPSGPVDLARPNLSICKVQFHFFGVFSLKKIIINATPHPTPRAASPCVSYFMH